MDPARSRQQQLSPEAQCLFIEGLRLVFSRWTALQMAVEEEWGGRNYRAKSKEIESAVISWFIQSEDPLYSDDLEKMLDENMVSYFNAEIEDDSIEEVAEQLMIIHEECLQGNYQSVESLKGSNPGRHAILQSKR